MQVVQSDKADRGLGLSILRWFIQEVRTQHSMHATVHDRWVARCISQAKA